MSAFLMLVGATLYCAFVASLTKMISELGPRSSAKRAASHFRTTP